MRHQEHAAEAERHLTDAHVLFDRRPHDALEREKFMAQYHSTMAVYELLKEKAGAP